ncbi:MAG TPA: ribonuclease R [Woeseiaceae bacterium]|nr:ribonuclease R [Woeseiaceae bacterium]
MVKRRKTAGKSGKYRHPVPGRAEILERLQDAGRPMPLEEIMQAFELHGARLRAALTDTLNRMVRAGQVIENRGGEYCLIKKLELITGQVLGHRDGFGFVLRDDGGDDAFLSPREMRSLFDGDRVAIRIAGRDRRGKPEARLVEILERGIEEVAGRFVRERGIGIVVPDNPKIPHRVLIPDGESGSAKPGQIVVARILDYPTEVQQATGRVVRIIGSAGQKGMATDIAIHAHAIPNVWPPDVERRARTFKKEVPAADKKGRTDLRDLPLVTIDGADARDFDDAVYCEPVGGGWRLLVAIADVGHYVQPGSEIDKEAIKRGTSVYFPDRVVPMLPEVLSNGLCSLNPEVDRLCMVCDMRIDASGRVTRSTFVEGLMRSAARLTYSQVNEHLTGGERSSIPKSLHGPLSHLHGLYKALASARHRRGAIELDIPQTRIELNRNGEVERIATVPRNDAHRLIEECMIAANVEAAKFLKKHRIPGLYRVHAKPDPDRFDDLRQYLLGLGLKVPHPEHVEPRHYNQMMSEVGDRPDVQSIALAMLRSLMHAEYTPVNIGHFGLALETYAHFTSPIRRYPDLLVHRAIRHIVQGGKAAKYRYSPGEMERLGTLCSAHERRAEDATRDVEARLKCQFMEDKVGLEFDGVITGVTNFGVFVQLADLAIDGLVHVSSLGNDYYHYDAGTQALVGERSGNRYRLGEALRVVVFKVDVENRRIDFRLGDERQAERKTRTSGLRRKKGGGRRRSG